MGQSIAEIIGVKVKKKSKIERFSYLEEVGEYHWNLKMKEDYKFWKDQQFFDQWIFKMFLR